MHELLLHVDSGFYVLFTALSPTPPAQGCTSPPRDAHKNICCKQGRGSKTARSEVEVAVGKVLWAGITFGPELGWGQPYQNGNSHRKQHGVGENPEGLVECEGEAIRSGAVLLSPSKGLRARIKSFLNFTLTLRRRPPTPHLESQGVRYGGGR